jgi:chemotaxis protein methyltransferase CheR
VLLALSSTIADRTGLTFAPYRRTEVAAKIGRAMEESNIDDAEQFVDRAQRDPGLMDALLLELTVGETYFFRDRPQFELLRQEIVPDIARAHDGTLRIWSAGCATGEEPYSIAILLAQLGLGHRASICATDLCRGRLTRAIRGRYGAWSLRDTPASVRRAFFTPDGDSAELLADVRRRVAFRSHNLVDPDAAAPWQDSADLVVCRNVLIYLRPDLIPGIARRLMDALRPGGWRVLGAFDPFIGDLVPCDVVATDAGVVYRRPLDSVRDAPAAPAPTASPRALAGAVARQPTLRETVGHVGLLLRCGDLDGAGRACAEALERHANAPEVHYQHASLLAAAGHHAESAAAARRVLYLDAASPLGYVALARARAALGDDVGAWHTFQRAERLLDAVPPGWSLPATEEGTAGELLRSVRLWLAVRG